MSQNVANTVVRKNNSSGYKGIYFDKRRSKWIAEVKYKYKKHYCGSYPTPELAHAAYCEKAKELFGELFNPG